MPSAFPHLNLPHKITGIARLTGGGKADPRVTKNKANRPAHTAKLVNGVATFTTLAKAQVAARQASSLPTISGGVPFLLNIPEKDDAAFEFLAEKLQLEIVGEFDDGFIIVASEDLDLQRVVDMAAKFAGSVHGSSLMANILNIDPDPSSLERIGRIVDPEILEQWPLNDAIDYTYDVSVEVASFGAPQIAAGSKRESVEEAERRLAEFATAQAEFSDLWDRKRIKRETEIEKLVAYYNGEILSLTDDGLVAFPDSFSARIKMNGQGFKDLIVNFPHIFEVAIPDDIKGVPIEGAAEDQTTGSIQILAPEPDANAICVIDSGMQEGHQWLSPAIKKTSSWCFIPDKNGADTADEVQGGGHGTRVAGACLYPEAIPTDGTHHLPFWLLNARVLDERNYMPTSMYPPDIIKAIVEYYLENDSARIYQHSVGSNGSFRPSRMSASASTIDLLSYQKDVLIIQSAGNITSRGNSNFSPGILDHLSAGRRHPDYLLEPSSRLANPSQSLQALTVGSVSGTALDGVDRKSMSRTNGPSAFSRSGYGMWDSIKPEVVEFGGDYVVDQGARPTLTTPSDVCPELLRSTLHGGPAFARDAVGTSFSTPKVTHIAAHLEKMFPDQPTLLYRALIVSSARWPQWAESLPPYQRIGVLKSFGYGIPNLERATENSRSRVTLISSSSYTIQAREGLIFEVPIPIELRRLAPRTQFRVDVTLSYAAEPRRTRKARRGYLGVWLDWRSSKKRESYESFKTRALRDEVGGNGVDEGNFAWILGSRSERDGETDGVSRANGTVQKDWTYAYSDDFTESFGIVVRGHSGWARANPTASAKFALSVSIEAISADVDIYTLIKAAVENEITVPAPRVRVGAT